MPPLPRPSYREATSINAPYVRINIYEIVGALVIAALLLFVAFFHEAKGEPRSLVRLAPDAPCHLVGDSIAQGEVPFFHECSVSTMIGAPVQKIIGWVRPATVVIISAGSNNEGQEIMALLDKVHARTVGAKRVIWIVPTDPWLATMVMLEAAFNHDRIVTFKPGGPRGQAHVHPGCPKCLADDIRIEMR